MTGLITLRACFLATLKDKRRSVKPKPMDDEGEVETFPAVKRWTCSRRVRVRQGTEVLNAQVDPPAARWRSCRHSYKSVGDEGDKFVVMFTSLCGLRALERCIMSSYNRRWERGPWPLLFSHKCIHAPSPIMRIHLAKSFNSRTCLDWL